MGLLAHWGLTSPPFSDDGAFVPLDGTETALSRLRYGTANGATALLTGPSGVGKTALARRLLDEFAGAGWRTAYFPRPTADAGDWHARLDPEDRDPRKAGESAFSALERGLRTAFRRGVRTVVAVDDLQTARGPAMADFLRALHNIVEDGRRVVHGLWIVQTDAHAGRPPVLSALSANCASRAALGPLTVEACRQYVAARLAAAGAGRGLMTRRAADAMAHFARGIPRDVNRIGDWALVIGFGLGMRTVTPDLVAMAAEDLGFREPRGDGGVLESLDADEDADTGTPPPPSVPPTPEPEPEPPDILASLAMELEGAAP